MNEVYAGPPRSKRCNMRSGEEDTMTEVTLARQDAVSESKRCNMRSGEEDTMNEVTLDRQDYFLHSRALSEELVNELILKLSLPLVMTLMLTLTIHLIKAISYPFLSPYTL